MQKFFQWFFKFIGWKIVGEMPDIKKFVLIVAPHTSNWDLIIGLIARFAVGRRIEFLAKHQVFFFPLGNFLTAVGGIPVERSSHHNMVEQVVEKFNQADELLLGIAPEGTRSPVKRWKQGFYHIAVQAKVPIVMVGMDFPSKEIRIQPPMQPSGDINQDFPKIIEYFRGVKGRHPKDIPDFEAK